MTDANTGVKSSHTGFPVHQGFYYAFDSLRQDLKLFLAKLKGVSVIHCVGHSLGGAIATLAADYIKANSAISSVKLYTFGSPRVGLDSFAQKCTSRLVESNIYRVSHSTDPVTALPTWPFCHVPNNRSGYIIESPMAIKPWQYHFMEYYIQSASKAVTWQAMGNVCLINKSDSVIEHWLKSDNFIVANTAKVLDMLSSAFVYVVKKILNTTGLVIVNIAAPALTLLDRMAMFMAKGIKVASDLSVWVFYLLRKMAAVIGMKITEGMDLTYAFIRFVFMRLHQKISDMIWRIGQEIS